MKKSKKSFVSLAAALLMLISTVAGSIGLTGVQVVHAAEPTGEMKPYTIYPNPHEITYSGQQFDVSDSVNVVYETHVDQYTKDRVEELLNSKDLTFTESTEIVADRTNFLVGIHQSGEIVDSYFKDNQLTDETVLAKLDANIISVQDNIIAILGKDVDSAFYGVTTVKHIFKQMQNRSIEELTIKDYADVKGRGFIEGYYGEPWSNEDRADLMTFGGDFKMNSYIYAPKDDPKHNGKWRELYTPEELVKISKLAEAGNASKTRFVYTLHPFMNNAIRFNTEENYQQDLAIIKEKFTQLMDSGVRKFGILADDAGVPPQGAETYVRLMKDLTNWLVEKQADYDGLVTDMIFCPNDYMGWGESGQIQTLRDLPKSVSLIQTGGKVWGEVSNNFTSSFTKNAGRGPYLWINWPCTDNSKQHLIMGGQETFLQPNVNPDNIEGIVLNPMQQAEPSKIAIFANADYAWNIWDSSKQADQNWNDSFAYVDHANNNETTASNALKELSKHMINQNMDTRVAKLEESVELAPKLNAFKAALGKEPIAGQATELITEFETILNAAETYKENPGNARTRDQIIYWLDSAIDTANAAISLLKAEIAHEAGDKPAVWENYSQGQAAFDASKNHPFRYIDHYQYAEVGVQHIVPFVKTLLNDVSSKVQSIVNPDLNSASVITNRTDTPTGDLKNLLDNNTNTDVVYKTPSSIAVGTYIGVLYEKPFTLNSARFELGRVGNDNDTFNASKLQVTVDGTTWTDVEGQVFGHVTQAVAENLNLKVKGVRLIATENREGTWLGIKDIVINEQQQEEVEELESKLMVPDHFKLYQGTEANLFDGNDTTFAWYNPSGTVKDTSVVGDYIGVDLLKVKNLGKVSFAIGRDSVDKWTDYQLEYSTDNVTYTKFKEYKGKASGMDKIDEDLTGVLARYVRVKNLKNVPVWLKFSEIKVESAKSNSEFTYTNNELYKGIASQHSLEKTSLGKTTDITLQPTEYIGLKLERIKELNVVNASETSGKLTLEASANAVEWKTPQEGTNARYVRFVNHTNEAITFNLDEFSVSSKEVYGPEFVETTMGIAPNWSENDSRKKDTLLNLFDKKLETKTIFADYQRKGEYITYSVGEPRIFNSLRIYNDENESNYIRDAVVLLSMDNKTWTDIATLGDGQDNMAGGKPDYSDKIKDGYTHDSVNPGNYYFGNEKIGGIEAKYIRILFTANYPARFAHMNEILINGGEFVKTENNPTFAADPIEEEGFGPGQLFDGDLTTAFKPNMSDRIDGTLTYRLSEKTDATAITIVQGSKNISNATVSARVGADEWVELGTLDSSLNTFYNSSYDNIFEIKLSWGDVQPLIYEMNISSNKDLVEKVNKAALVTAIAEAEKNEQADYTAESWKGLSEALLKAKEVNKKTSATQSEVDQATTNLTTALGKLVVNPISLELEVENATITAGEELDLRSLITLALDSKGNDAAQSVVINAGGFDHNAPGTYEVTFTLAEDGVETIVKTAIVTVEKVPSQPITEIADLYTLVAHYKESGDILDKKAVKDLEKQIKKIEKEANKGKGKDKLIDIDQLKDKNQDKDKAKQKKEEEKQKKKEEKEKKKEEKKAEKQKKEEEKQNKKVVKELNKFKSLLDKQLQKKQITGVAYQGLTEGANVLIEKRLN
ncbi:hyaluronoglucosaminidase [Sporosarcina sp. BI001-red]|uniref:beta-N-acetylglucosaminidase domain-containing protein n=1 Tax=Sporosarcina sp. BI001-red TaxID=2282866 RepID=UPI000E27EAE4|nr:beta-N-acetylglucosaminidase domain-containing protein [Sporosarcina sp. BI001-red]REB08748.1 hyaluronoglucosaminidase [Sporosarcina sp. BI001-red]